VNIRAVVACDSEAHACPPPQVPVFKEEVQHLCDYLNISVFTATFVCYIIHFYATLSLFLCGEHFKQ
jgi:hypothetical protein